MEEKIIIILKEVVDELRTVNILEDTKLISSGFLDSFDVIAVLAKLEESFGVNIPLDEVEFEDFNSVSQIANIINSELSN